MDPKAQGSGVASALIVAAETRLMQGGCTQVQIEYEYTSGHAHSQRLEDWYEGKLGFERNWGWFVNRLIGSMVSRRGGGVFSGNQFRQCRRSLVTRQQPTEEARSCSLI